jgi:hypothetical protein
MTQDPIVGLFKPVLGQPRSTIDESRKYDGFISERKAAR